MSQYGGYGNPYYGGYYYPYDNQTPYYGYGQPDYVSGHAEGSGASLHNFEDIQPPHGYTRIYPEYQNPYDLRKCSSRNKNLWLQSLENNLKLFQKLMPSASGGAVINVD
ncbi:hypothetical protein BY996DRAFT_6613007 [Phakopsora pachyrhizi]|nr:hypothetical protein BY996DRAFT_6613007 [Phakopsora pachyrhizi]